MTKCGAAFVPRHLGARTYVILVACHDVIGNSLTGAGSGLDWSKRDSIKEQRSSGSNTQQLHIINTMSSAHGIFNVSEAAGKEYVDQ